VRFTPLTVMLSAAAGLSQKGLSQNSIAATAAYRDFLGMGFVRRGLWGVPILQMVPGFVRILFRELAASTGIGATGRHLEDET
jgi:hypothetical protein